MRKSKNNKNNTTTIIPSTSDKTPIEIALQIDSDGMTTASKLYAFLELNPSNFASWCRRNITRNKFATENEDYIVFVVENENPKLGGRPKTDYKLTSEFAKKLSMTGNTEKHEQARNYFIACEQGLKIATAKLQATGISNNQAQEKLKAQENGYGGYYTYYDILHYIIPNIEIAIRNLKKIDEKKEDYIKDWETNWDLYGTSELDALNKKYTEELEKVQDYAKPWSELTDEEKRANSGNEDSYNIYHNKYVEIYCTFWI